VNAVILPIGHASTRTNPSGSTPRTLISLAQLPTKPGGVPKFSPKARYAKAIERAVLIIGSLDLAADDNEMLSQVMTEKAPRFPSRAVGEDNEAVTTR
jgi:hypothetical protein